jgi:hypothetical protein
MKLAGLLLLVGLSAGIQSLGQIPSNTLGTTGCTVLGPESGEGLPHCLDKQEDQWRSHLHFNPICSHWPRSGEIPDGIGSYVTDPIARHTACVVDANMPSVLGIMNGILKLTMSACRSVLWLGCRCTHGETDSETFQRSRIAKQELNLDLQNWTLWWLWHSLSAPQGVRARRLRHASSHCRVSLLKVTDMTIWDGKLRWHYVTLSLHHVTSIYIWVTVKMVEDHFSIAGVFVCRCARNTVKR